MEILNTRHFNSPNAFQAPLDFEVGMTLNKKSATGNEAKFTTT